MHTGCLGSLHGPAQAAGDALSSMRGSHRPSSLYHLAIGRFVAYGVDLFGLGVSGVRATVYPAVGSREVILRVNGVAIAKRSLVLEQNHLVPYIRGLTRYFVGIQLMVWVAGRLSDALMEVFSVHGSEWLPVIDELGFMRHPSYELGLIIYNSTVHLPSTVSLKSQ